jgi:hypothetical protein
LAPAERGVPNAKSTTAQIVDTCGNLETYAVIDKDIADLNGNTAEFRLSEVRAFLEGMSQQVAATFIYGNQHTNPERFTGLAPRYSTVTAANSQTATTSSTPAAPHRPTPPCGSSLGARHHPRHLPQGQDHRPPAPRYG